MSARLLLLGLLAAACFVLAVATSAPMAPAGPVVSTGPCWVRLNDDPTEYPSVQAAVDASTSPADVVKVAGYCGGVEQRFGLTQTVYLTKTLTLQGGYTVTNWSIPDPLAHPTVLDAQGQGRVLLITGAITPTVSGLRLTGGDATRAGFDPYGHNNGGGLYVLSATATISGCVVYGNAANRGGGIFAYDSRVTMYGSIVTDNSAVFIGGGMLMYEGAGRLEGNTFVSNTAGTGGGAYFGSEAVTLTYNTFFSNTALYDGGGLIVEIYGGHSQLVGNTVAGNRAYWNGGGLYFGEGVRADIEGFFPGGAGLLPPFPCGLDLGQRSCAGARGPQASGGGEQGGRHASGGMAGSPAKGVAPSAHPRDAGAKPLLFAGNIVTQNWAHNHGGGVFMSGDGGAADLIGNTVAENEAGADGGGIYLDWSADPTPILSNTVSANAAGRNGGGIYLGAGTATLRGNAIRHNRAGGDGGGVCGRGAVLANTIAANIAGQWGGGVALRSGTATLINNWITDNQAGRDGAAVSVIAAGPHLLHNAIAGTAAAGSAVHVGAAPPLYGSLLMTNTILVSHTIGITVAAGCTATLEATLWGNSTDWAGSGTIVTGTINVWGDPAFLDPAAGDYHIGPTSAARDTGVDAGVYTDIDGDVRPLGAGYDIGADEAPAFCFRIYLPLALR